MKSTQAPILTVSQLTEAIKQQLENSFPLITLQGEISNFKAQSSGHLYFSLKDSNAQIGAVMFRGSAQSLKTVPKNGDNVVVKGEINVYPPRGNYQIIIRELRLAGLGELLLRLEQLKREIHSRGWFSPQHKKPLPPFPKRIGVVTSPTGAAVQDILNILSRRVDGIDVLINPVRVQGDEAAKEIAQAITDFNKYQLADVLIVGRGGGSIEDLWAFNEEIVAEAIFHSKIPIVAAVGHETDHCIAEYVADIRAPTPSAAAEIVTTERLRYQQAFSGIEKRLAQTVHHLIRQNTHRLEGLARHPLLASPYAFLGQKMQQIDEIKNSLDSHIKHLLGRYSMLLQGFERQALALSPITRLKHHKNLLLQKRTILDNLIKQILQKHQEQLKSIITHLYAVDPKNVLKKGYSILFSEKNNSVITSVKNFKKDEDIRILVTDGEALATIKGVKDSER